MKQNVLVIIGAGGLGLAAARRLGSGRHTLLASYSARTISFAQQSLQDEGYSVSSIHVDISSYDSVKKVADAASALGHIDAIILTSGVTPVSANAKQIYEVDFLGHANVIDAFLPIVSLGTSVMCIASMAPYFAAALSTPLSQELEKHLATAPLNKLLQYPEIDLSDGNEGAGTAYMNAKRGNQIRVEAAAKAYGLKGARINSVSPGVIMTKQGKLELEGRHGPAMKGLIENSALGRAATPEQIVNVIAFLVSQESSFITGVDILADGGAIA
ncbi:putative short-chain dehydrogenase, partial [Mollisia scopiformis]